MRKGVDGLAMLVQQVLQETPFGGAIFAFRGRRGGLIKLLWYDGQGMCLFSKRLEHGHFVWPVTDTGRAHLPRVEVVIDVDDKTCPCCRGSMHQIGEDQAEMLDYVPGHLQVRVIRRPRYGCRGCEEAVVQAPAPDRPIDGGIATEALLAHVLVNKYADHLPLFGLC
jgi:transposase